MPLPYTQVNESMDEWCGFKRRKRMNGKVVRMMKDKGFGFIECKGNDYFFHMSQCKTPFMDLRIEDNVEFEIDQSPKGPRAKDVEKI